MADFRPEPLTLNELRTLTPERLASRDILERLRASAVDPTYWSEMGEAGDFLSLFEERVRLIPFALRSEGVADALHEVAAMLHFWILPTLDPNEAQSWIRENAQRIARAGLPDLTRMFPRVLLRYGGASDAFLRWVDAMAEGLRFGTERLGNQVITTFTGKASEPLVGEWIRDFERFSLNHPGGASLTISSYLSRSGNAQQLSETDRQALGTILRWFFILRFGPEASPGSESPVQSRPAPDQRRVRPVSNVQPSAAATKTAEPQARPYVPPAPVRPMPSAQPVVESPAARTTVLRRTQPIDPLERVRERLKAGQAMIQRIEQAEQVLPAFGPSSIGQLATLIRETLTAKVESTRSLAGLFQVARTQGLDVLMRDPVFLKLVRETVQPALVTELRLNADVANQAVQRAENQESVLKEFLRLFLFRTTGETGLSARLMVHLASIVPESKIGQERTFVFFDLPSDQFVWMPTMCSPEGILSNRSAER